MYDHAIWAEALTYLCSIPGLFVVDMAAGFQLDSWLRFWEWLYQESGFFTAESRLKGIRR